MAAAIRFDSPSTAAALRTYGLASDDDDDDDDDEESDTTALLAAAGRDRTPEETGSGE